MKPLVAPASSLSTEEVRRYSRHLIIPNLGLDGQKRLKNAKVLVVGAGGLGSPTLMYLAAAGVGTLGIVDGDRVEISNLQRQVIHGVQDIGRLKTESAQDAVAAINPFVHVQVHETRLDSSNVMNIMSAYDIVVDGTDNFATRYLINDAAVILGKPVVWGAIYRFAGQASVFWATHGPCYRCLFPEPPPPGMVPTCAEGGVLGVLCASIGSIQSTETLKLITGIGESLVGSLMVYDALDMEYRRISVRKDPHCSVCSEHPTQSALLDDYELFCGLQSPGAIRATEGSTISVVDLKRMMDNNEKIYLVDVREPAEFDILSIPEATLVPKDEILTGRALAALPHDRKIVLYCKSGTRSAQCLAALKDAGFSDALHLAGGVIAWATEIDTSLPIY